MENIHLDFDAILAFAPRLIFALAMIVVMWLIGKAIGAALQRLAQGQRSNLNTLFITKRVISWILIIAGLILAMQILGMTAIATSLLATGGFLAIILGFAFKEIGENLLAGLFLTFSRSFDVGDYIENNGLRGIVKGINLRDVQIRTADGCDIFIPCVAFFRYPLHNYTRDGLRRSSFRIGVDYGDDLDKAHKLLLQVVNSLPKILSDPRPSVDLSSFSSQTVEFDVYFWVDTFDKNTDIFALRSHIMHECHRILDEHGYTFNAEVSTAVTLSPVEVTLKRDSNK